MDALETECFLESDASRFGGRDETKIPYEENTFLKNRLVLDAFEFASERIGHGVSEIERQGSGADGGAIVKLNLEPARRTRAVGGPFANLRRYR